MSVEFYNELLNEFEQNGKIVIIRGLRKCIDSEYDLHIVCYPEEDPFGEGTIYLKYEYEDYDTDLYNFGDCLSDCTKYKGIHNELFKNGMTEIEDFEKWFKKECCLDSEIETIFEIVKNNISGMIEIEAKKEEEKLKRIEELKKEWHKIYKDQINQTIEDLFELAYTDYTNSYDIRINSHMAMYVIESGQHYGEIDEITLYSECYAINCDDYYSENYDVYCEACEEDNKEPEDFDKWIYEEDHDCTGFIHDTVWDKFYDTIENDQSFLECCLNYIDDCKD